ncbi:ATP-dependent DNA helicase pfh1 [Holothuria leucospilota]|uniref:ATP-dependent DNA helicase pfh1 n=1 Tax=Holothuria leucospilota TaxID=206669 RepID=A0A9Q1C9C7_HOLLE|nr:ATP-dependent DNA helicase pfh1 [Holothuria leucospilota]
MKKYQSEDSGDLDALLRCAAHKMLYLKVGAPVIVLANLSQTLVNGLQGTVQEMYDDYVTVKFDKLDANVDIHPYMFSVYKSDSKRNVAYRKQLPLSLAFALTVHKAQGMTVDRLVIDCRNMVFPGQIGVAIGRAVSKKGTQVINFRESLVQPQPKEIRHFYESAVSVTQLGSAQCCKQIVFPPKGSPENMSHTEEVFTGCEHEILDTSMDIDDEEDVDDVNFLELYERASQPAMEELPPGVKSHSLLDALLSEDESYTAFYGAVQNFMSSATYKEYVEELFLTSNVSKSQYRVAYGLSQKLREHLLEGMTEHIRKKALERATASSKSFTDSEGGRATLRYISGWCVASMRKRKRKTVIQNLYSESTSRLVTNTHKQVELLEQLIVPYGELKESTSDLPSLVEIHRKENPTSSLCYVTDKAFEFFKELDKAVRMFETKENVDFYGGDLYSHVLSHVVGNDAVNTVWNSLYPWTEQMEETQTLKEELIKKYINFSSSQYRKELKRAEKVKSKEAHRKQIKITSKQTPSVEK